ncbi:Uncharacterised protein [Vibrio cholerae]|nr:Uncharacterised protein [Vibrio cholerae]
MYVRYCTYQGPSTKPSNCFMASIRSGVTCAVA